MKIVNLLKIVNCIQSRKLKINKGFTLIELLVVIAIVGLLMSISAAAIFSARNKRSAKAAAEQVKNVIIEAHAYAISPKTQSQAGPVGIFINDPGNTFHKIQANVIDPGPGPNTGRAARPLTDSQVVGPVDVPSNITLGCTSDDNTRQISRGQVCINLVTDDGNKMGQTTANPPNYFTATKNGTDEKYKIAVSPLSGNVTITKL